MNRITGHFLTWTTKPRVLTMVSTQRVAFPVKTTISAGYPNLKSIGKATNG